MLIGETVPQAQHSWLDLLCQLHLLIHRLCWQNSSKVAWIILLFCLRMALGMALDTNFQAGRCSSHQPSAKLIFADIHWLQMRKQAQTHTLQLFVGIVFTFFSRLTFQSVERHYLAKSSLLRDAPLLRQGLAVLLLLTRLTLLISLMFVDLCDTVDGIHPARLVGPIVYGVSDIQGGARFLPSTVCCWCGQGFLVLTAGLGGPLGLLLSTRLVPYVGSVAAASRRQSTTSTHFNLIHLSSC